VLYIPIGLLFFLAFWLLFGAVALLLQIGILRYVFERMGVSRRYMLALLLFSLLGSYVNIPIWRMPGEPMRAGQIVDFYGVPYVVPVLVRSPGTILAVNLGGAIIPLVLSIYLMVKHQLYEQSLIAVAIVTLLVHLMAQPVPGV